MGLRFLLGRAGTEKSGRCLDEIKKKASQSPKGPPIFYIVPDQMTFQQEYALFQDENIQGSIRVQVVSFSRLAWRILQETGGGARQFISSVGIQMMLQQIIEEKQAGWHVFEKAMEKQGFLDQLEEMIAEFKRYRITPDMLHAQIDQMKRFAESAEDGQVLTGKLMDLTYIYEKLIHGLEGKYIDGEDQLDLLAQKAGESELLKGAEIYLDGFHRLTPQELHLVEALMRACSSVTVTLTMDEDSNMQQSAMDLFHQTKETYQNLRTIAEKNNIPIKDEPVLTIDADKFRHRPAHQHLEAYFDTRPAPAYEHDVPFTIAEAVHPRAEVEGTAQEILRLIREEGYRYRDMAVFIREPDTYHDLLDTIFGDYEIPFFIDDKQPMVNHALIEFIRSALDVVGGNWRYDAVFRLLKTGFIPADDPTYPLDDDAIDTLENYCLEYGIRFRERWMSGEDWKFQRFYGMEKTAQTDAEREMEEKVNAYRRQVVRALEPFDVSIRKVRSVREMCEQIYMLMETLHVPERLEKLKTYYDDIGLNEKGREQEQVWDAVVQLFDEMVEIAGGQEMTLETFQKVLEAGLESLKFAHVPPSIDHVTVGTIDRSRFSDVRCGFLLGVNEGVWPMKPPLDGMINEKEREELDRRGIKLADSSTRQLLDDWFYMYIAFTAASDRLWLSYPLSDEEGKTKMPSQLISRMEDLFPVLRDHVLLDDPEELRDAERFITTPLKTRAALTAQLARHQKGYDMDPVWWHVLNWYMINQPIHGTTHATLKSLHYRNEPVNLSEATSERLHPRQVQASVSRLETYYRCSYQHFAQYSLGLEERRTYKLEAPDIGNLFHEALKKITEWIQAGGNDFKDIHKHDARGYARQAVEELAPVLQHEILKSSNRYKYIQQKLETVIARATYILSEQARRTEFSPVGLELGFGKQEELPPVSLKLENGFELLLRGRIDRIDKAEHEDDLFLRIIDYKSSAKTLNLAEVYYGLALQMLTYLDVVISHSEQWLGTKASPAGVLYFHVHDPMISARQKLSDAELEKEIFKQYKMQGLLLSDEEVVRLMDTSVQSGWSETIPAGVKKDGGFYSNSRIASADTFQYLQQHIHRLMYRAGIDITSGGIHLNPFRNQKQEIACTFCPFKPVCQFDATLEENNFHMLSDMDNEEALETIRREEGN